MPEGKQKRIPFNSLTIIIKFSDKDHLANFLSDSEYQRISSELSHLALSLASEINIFTNP